MKIKGKYLFKPEADKLLHLDQILPAYANKILPEHSHIINPSLKKKIVHGYFSPYNSRTE